MPKPAVSGCPPTRGRVFLSVVSYVVKRKKGLASWRSPFCFSGTNAPADVVTLFQSTLPRGRRLRRVLVPTSIWHFNPRPPRGGRLDEGTRTQTVKVFQSTPPRGGRPPATSCPPSCSNFNPRPPCGGRLAATNSSAACSIFQSTSPPRGTTHLDAVTLVVNLISIHAPTRGATLLRSAGWSG